MTISTLHINGKNLKVDLSAAIDLSLPLAADPNCASAWYVDPVSIEPVRKGAFVGSVKEGGSVNFRDIKFNPHGNGTHTESVGHIAKEVYSVNQYLKFYFFEALLITVTPEKKGNDFIITEEQVRAEVGNFIPQALIIRTLPNTEGKKHRQYSNTNPAFLDHKATAFIAASKIDHLLVDLPSVDQEEDGGQLLAHHAFWEHPHNTQFQRTITEFIFVPDAAKDGLYVLNLMMAPFENDASPSRPLIYPVIP